MNGEQFQKASLDLCKHHVKSNGSIDTSTMKYLLLII